MKVRDWNIATVGRLLAVAIIVVGVALSAWDAGAVSANTGIPHYKLRSFFSESLQYIWLGGLLLAIAEIAARFGSVPAARRVDWNLTTLLRVLGVAIILGGISLTVWGGRIGLSGAFDFSGNSVYSGSKRAITRRAIEYAWQGGLLIVAAEIADRLGWGRGEDELAEAELAEQPEGSPTTP
jgi:hypothetical protein